MKHFTATSLSTLVLIFVCVGHASLTPQRFAAGIPVRAADEAAVQVLELPQAVYEGVQRPDLGDLRVFNADGGEVPYALLGGDLRASETRREPLRFFRLEGETIPEFLRLQLEQAPGTSLDLTVPASVPTATREGRAAYLLDASGSGGALSALQLEWDEASGDFLTALSVETSDDLRRWRPLSTASVARLRREGTLLERTLVSLPPTSAPYLRLTPLEGDTLPPLSGAEGTFTSEQAEQTPLEPLLLAPADVQTEADRYTFGTGGFFPAERAELRLPQPNTLVRVQVLSSASSDGPWTRRYEGLLYRLIRGGQEVTAPSMTFTPTADPYWQVRVDGAGGGFGGGEPGLELHYRPHTLLFLARGEGPYTLAYGSASATSAAFAPSDLLQALPGDAKLLKKPRANLGTPVTLAGASALGETRPFPWSRVLLWGVLVLGVGLLGWLAFGLLRRLDQADER